MKKFKTLLLLMLMASCLLMKAHPVTDTLYSPENDWVVVSYNLAEKDGKITISITQKDMELSDSHRKVYNPSEVKAMFFDRFSLRDIIIENSSLNHAVFMFPSTLKYTPSKEGYFLLEDGDRRPIQFEGQLTKPETISIPIFLAQYKRAKHYKIFAQCENLEIEVGRPKMQVQEQPSGKNTEKTKQVIVDVIDELGDMQAWLREVEDDAKASANYIENLLSKKPPVDEKTLSTELEKLRITKCKLQEQKGIDPKVIKRLEKVLEAGDKSLDSMQKERIKLDSINKPEPQSLGENPEPGKQDNTWMFVGGAILAVLMFVGSQVMQNIRSKKSMENIKKMQEMQMQQANASINNQNQDDETKTS